MNRHVFTCTIVTLLFAGNAAIAQTDFYTKPQITAEGDYLTNAGPVLGKVSSGSLQAGALWRVVAAGLNCRRNADRGSAIVRSFQKGTVLQADLGRGGADEVFLNAKDQQGKPWMRVRSQTGMSYQCYVRANRQYIQPVMK